MALMLMRAMSAAFVTAFFDEPASSYFDVKGEDRFEEFVNESRQPERRDDRKQRRTQASGRPRGHCWNRVR